MRKFFEYLQNTVWKSRLKTCFWVAPVRIGLIVLAYLHLILAIVQIASLSSEVVLLWPLLAHISISVNELNDGAAPSSLCVLHPASDLVFTGILLAGLYRRDVVILRFYCWYGLVNLFLAFVVYGLLVAVIKPLFLALVIISGIYQIYFLLLVRSLKIEIELNVTNDGNKYMYNKDQGVVIVRDVESPMPRPIILDGYRILPALPAPDMTTSITTLNDQRPEYPLDSKYNTLNQNSTLKTNTLQSYKVTLNPADNTPRSATLPYQDTAIVHKQYNTQRIGAVHSLAGPSNVKTFSSNTDTLKKEFVNPTFATVSKSAAAKETKPEDDIKTDEDDIKTDDKDTEGKNKSGDEPKKKKRGLFRKAQKEETSKKSDVDKKLSMSDSPKPIYDKIKAANLKKDDTKNTKNTTSVGSIDNNEKLEPLDAKTDDEKEVTVTKKKRGLFKKQSKEHKSEKKKEIDDEK